MVVDMLHVHYDCIVVGGGIAGLLIARSILKTYPTCSVALAEQYKGLGGRTYTYKPHDFTGIQWEMGAGRIHKSHSLVLDLLKEYGLHTIPISSDSSYITKTEADMESNIWDTVLVPVYLEPLRHLSQSILEVHTITSLMNQIYGVSTTNHILSHFPYKAEVSTLRADLGLKSFFGGTIGNSSGFCVVKEGFSALVAALKKDVEARGCTILGNHKLVSLYKGPSTSTDLTFRVGPEGIRIVLRASQAAVLAIHRDGLAALRPFKGLPLVTHIKTEPLLRIYMIFDTSKGPVWFSDLGKVVTPQRPRYILPMDASKGVIMISYTDGSDTRSYITKDPATLEAMVLEDIRALFPTRTIPKPLLCKAHPWNPGASYWLPGHYNPETISTTSIHPLPVALPNVWVCGESWSLCQTWVQGAIEQSQLCFRKLKKTLHR